MEEGYGDADFNELTSKIILPVRVTTFNGRCDSYRSHILVCYSPTPPLLENLPMDMFWRGD